MLAYSGSTWTEIIISASIFVPVVVTLALAWFFLRGAGKDPDEQRLRRAQREYETRRDR